MMAQNKGLGYSNEIISANLNIKSPELCMCDKIGMARSPQIPV